MERYRLLKRLLGNKGFTLVEMLVVLSLLMTMAFAIPIYTAAEEERTEQRFFQTLLADIYFMQSESYRSGEWVQLTFGPDGGSYTISRNYSAALVSRNMPAGVRMDKTSYLKNIRFNPIGSIETAGTIRFLTPEGPKVLTVHLGKGRVVLSG
ncbi:type II secretion system protein [Planococcus lenghuensis]|uniref:Prepilin-type N-terminal cleavage/methylation domain-containing protein n=1 Tax=Planococcus lenghuensis TaxID=2213202 RepID=A0A1Q2KXS2_9BACL|nr:type II secretion system protein [Planococcus lenghuensis]AQQ53008.1 hypothetical protein B0X71_07825 [Planococcus lenghuensis]